MPSVAPEELVGSQTGEEDARRGCVWLFLAGSRVGYGARAAGGEVEG